MREVSNGTEARNAGAGAGDRGAGAEAGLEKGDRGRRFGKVALGRMRGIFSPAGVALRVQARSYGGD